MSRRGSSDGAALDGANALNAADDTTLAGRLLATIRREGAMTFRDWMAAALYDGREGYYTRPGLERWGRAGDYRTSPERTLLFAATFARYFAKLHEELGSPNGLLFIESGGGAGRFALTLLDTLRRDRPRLYDSIRYVFDETGADSRARAAALLAPHSDRVEFRNIEDFISRAQHSTGETPNTSPNSAAFIVFSNELLDAMPVHRVVARGGRLRELYVTENPRGGFALDEREPSTPRLAEHFARLGLTLAEGRHAEVNLEAESRLARVASLEGTGFVVTVDYGDDARSLFESPHRQEGTLRAFSGHKLAEDPLARPGEQDLTTTVNWTHIISAGEAAGLKTVALERLDAFLLKVGLIEQLERECERACDAAEVARLRLGAREMILPGGMAASFQVLVQKKSL